MTDRSDDMEPHGRGALCEMLRAMGHGTHDDQSLAFEAADEIERLRARLRDAVIYAEQFDESPRLRAWARETRKLLNEQLADGERNAGN